MQYVHYYATYMPEQATTLQGNNPTRMSISMHSCSLIQSRPPCQLKYPRITGTAAYQIPSSWNALTIALSSLTSTRGFDGLNPSIRRAFEPSRQMACSGNQQ